MFYEVILDSGETANKCTIAPLESRPDFRLFRVKGAAPIGPLQSEIILHHEGEDITGVLSSKKILGIAAVDCVWKRLPTLLKRVQGAEPRPVRIPSGFVTAYPRKSERDDDPSGGLATIEALFIAAALNGNWDATLLKEYFFSHRFLELNFNRLLELGVHQVKEKLLWPTTFDKKRNSLQRRRDRGRSGK